MSIKTLLAPHAKDWLNINVKSLSTGTITESATGAGVIIDGTLIKDGVIKPLSAGSASLGSTAGGILETVFTDGESFRVYRSGDLVNPLVQVGIGAAGRSGFVSAETKKRVAANDVPIFVDSVTGAIGIASSIKASKCNIGSLDNSDNLYKIAPVKFNRRKFDDDGVYSKTEYYPRTDVGFIAEDIEEHLPNCVTRNEEGKLTGIQNRFIYAHAVKCIQEQKKKIDQLEKRIEALE